MVKSSNLCRIDRARRNEDVMSALGRLGFVKNPAGQGQQTGANLQMRAFSRQEIHLEPQSFSLHREADDSAGSEEIWRFSNSQHIGSFQSLQELCVAPGFRAANESDLAIAKLQVFVHPADYHDSAMRRGVTSKFGE